MIDKLAYTFWLLCLSILISGAVWKAAKQYEHKRMMNSVVHKVQIERMYDQKLHGIEP